MASCKRRKSLGPIALLTLWFVASAMRPQTAEPTTPFALSIYPQTSELRIGSRMPLKVVVSNLGSEPMSIQDRLGPPEREQIVEVDLIQKSGEHVPKWFELLSPAYRRKLMKNASGSTTYLDIAAGAKLETIIDLSQIFKITSPGKYTVTVSRRIVHSIESVQSSPVEIDILASQKQP